MRVTMMLADSAQAVDGKLYILGGGWSIATSGAMSALALKLEVPWDLANQQHQWRIDLLTEDGEPVMAGDGTPLHVEGQFEVGRPAGIPEGTPIDLPLAINIGPLPLPAGRYVWQLIIDGQ